MLPWQYVAAAAAAAALCRQAGRTAAWRAGLCSLQHPCLIQVVRGGSAVWPEAAGVYSLSPWALPPAPHCQQGRWHHNAQQQRQQPCRVVPPLSLQPFSTDTRLADGSSKSRPHHHQQQQEQQGRRQRYPGTQAIAAFQAAGWSRREVLNVPNALSMLRLLSGPVIATWIIDGQWSLAVPALAVSSATDWADGYAARRLRQPSVIGSYLDPLADKVLICSMVAALGWLGVLPVPVVCLVVGRDVVLVACVCVARVQSLGWRWLGLAEFFRIQPAAAAAAAPSARSDSGRDGRGVLPAAAVPAAAGASAALAAVSAAASASAEDGGAASPASSGNGSGSPVPAAPLMQPLYISKVNTVFQLGLVGTCMLNSWLGWPGEAAVWVASSLTAGTTLWSSWAYLRAYRLGRVLARASPW